MKGEHGRFFRWLSLFLVMLLFSATGIAEDMEEPAELFLKTDSRLSFSNAVYHYVEIQAEAKGADQLVLRVYKPDGTQAKYKVRRNTPTAQDAGMSSAYPVYENGNGLSGTELLFASNCATGTWTIEVRALRKKETVATATLAVEVWNPQRIELTDYERVHAMLLMEENTPQPVERGKIRFVAQLPEDHCFINAYWRSKYYDLKDSARNKCTRAIFSMGLSWLGIDCTPVRMSELVKAKEIYYTYEHVIDALGNIEQLDGKLELLWNNYIYGGASPVEIHFNYQGGMHALLLIARDTQNPDVFYALNPSEGVDATAYGGKKHDHVIPIIIEDGRIGGVIQSPLIKRYHKGKIDVICQWALIEEEDR